jgi:uncharacterized membrane protein
LEEFLAFAAEIVDHAMIVMLLATAAVGGLKATLDLVMTIGKPDARQRMKRAWVDFASWLLISLQFALAADLVSTAVSPSWDDIGQLGAIAAIRIALGFFLGRDIEEFRRERTLDGNGTKND